MAEQFYTMNGCYFTKPSVNPKDWKRGGIKSLKKDWQIQFYFFDPNHAKTKPWGKLVPIRGMNHCKNLNKRRAITKVILEDAIESMENGYNHFTGQFMTDDSIKHGILHPELNFIKAFRIAYTKLNNSESYLESVKYGIDHIEQSAIRLKLQNIKIDDLKRRHVKMLLDACGLTDDGYNRHKCYLSSLFNQLVEFECCEHNLTRDIGSKQVVKKVRDVFSSNELEIIYDHLKKKDYNLYRFAKIFMMSGSRISELFRLKWIDIDIENQEYTVLIKKGKLYTETKKVIIPAALSFWREIFELRGDSDYVFSDHFIPGNKLKKRAYLTQIWRRKVKQELQITPDFYTLKHSFLDSLNLQDARMMASHTSSSTTAIYRIGEAKRERDALKKLII